MRRMGSRSRGTSEGGEGARMRKMIDVAIWDGYAKSSGTWTPSLRAQEKRNQNLRRKIKRYRPCGFPRPNRSERSSDP